MVYNSIFILERSSMAEHSAYIRGVAGSSPAVPTNIKKHRTKGSYIQRHLCGGGIGRRG